LQPEGIREDVDLKQNEMQERLVERIAEFEGKIEAL